MKKRGLKAGLFLILTILVFVSVVDAYYLDLLQECAEKEGWSLDKAKKYNLDGVEDPVQYTTTFFKILSCHNNKALTKESKLYGVPESQAIYHDSIQETISPFLRNKVLRSLREKGDYQDPGDIYDTYKCEEKRTQCINSRKAAGESYEEAYWKCQEIYRPCRSQANLDYFNAFEEMMMDYAKLLQGEQIETGEDTCFNNKQDEGEEGIDCGGPCIQRCSYDVSINPPTATLFADGKSTQQFILTALSEGSPLKNEQFALSFWFPFDSKIMDAYGQIKPASITTNENGKASFTYYSPRAPDGAYLKNLNFEIRATGKTGAKTKINLIDPKPRIKIKLDKRSMLEGNEMNFADVTIIDENSKEWSIKVATNIGKLIPTGRAGEFNTLTDKTQKKEYHFNWKPPASAVELIDGTLEYIKDHKNDWSSYTSGLKEDTTNLAVKALPLSDVREEVESYVSQYETWNGNINQLQRDINRIQTSTSSYEKFLRSLSLGLEGLQIFYGTKGFVEGKLEGDSSSSFKECLEGIRDKTIDYGVDSLQSGLRYWANLVRESNLDTIRIPVHIVVEVTDDEGFTTKKTKIFQYIYHIE